jgi:hypothetical protein
LTDISEVVTASIIRGPDNGRSNTSEILVNFYQTAQRNITDDIHLQFKEQNLFLIYMSSFSFPVI